MQGMPRTRRAVLVVALACLLASAVNAHAQLTVAAASDLQAVLPQIAEGYRQARGETVRISFGSSGQFVAQIQNGAPFDVFLSADTAYAERLIASGHARRETLTPYANGRLVLWARRDRGLDVSRGLAVLTDPRVRRVAIANPEHAPYGRAALAALQRAGVQDAVQSKLVLGENIAQTAQFVQSGNADAGLIALSLALAPALRDVGVAFEVPATSHPPLRQAAVAITGSRRPDAARAFIAYLKDPAIVALLQASGFGTQP